jgi:hypothetical protein
MQSGIHTRYWWLETDHSLREFLPVCPAVIVGRHIAITAVDSGCFNPSDDDRAAGWNATGGIAYSPRLESVAALPSDCCCGHGGFDEWYVFGVEPPVLGAICHANVFEKAIASPNVFQFINFYGFQLSNAHMKALADLFWTQMEWVRPESYVGDGDRCLMFVSSDHQLFVSVRDTLSRFPPRAQTAHS